ncbi:MAG: hypothetical protein J7K68_02985 [Candidatus Diapherotrites archaeon]|nr:hypothetical protein [Candidatus Diapherotrites archaeon]
MIPLKKTQQKEIAGYIIAAIFWYLFLWSLLYYIRMPDIDIYTGALVLFVTGLVGTVACPWFWKYFKM